MTAIDHIHSKILPAINGSEITGQRAIDQAMIELDGTEYKNNIGANAMLAVRLAAARAGAAEKGVPLYRYLSDELGSPNTGDGARFTCTFNEYY